MKNFFIALAVTALLILAVTEGMLSRSYIIERPSFLYQTIIFLAFTTGVIFVYLRRANKPEVFVQLYLFMMAMKLLAYGGYAYFMITSDTAGATSNVVLFMASYFIFTGLEIVFLYRKIGS